MLALTATASRSMQAKVGQIIGIKNPTVIAIAPCKENLMYSVATFTSFKKTFGTLLATLHKSNNILLTV